MRNMSEDVRVALEMGSGRSRTGEKNKVSVTGPPF